MQPTALGRSYDAPDLRKNNPVHKKQKNRKKAGLPPSVARLQKIKSKPVLSKKKKKPKKRLRRFMTGTYRCLCIHFFKATEATYFRGTAKIPYMSQHLRVAHHMFCQDHHVLDLAN